MNDFITQAVTAIFSFIIAIFVSMAIFNIFPPLSESIEIVAITFIVSWATIGIIVMLFLSLLFYVIKEPPKVGRKDYTLKQMKEIEK